MQIDCESPKKGDVVSRVAVSINTKDVFNFGEQISQEVVKQLSDIIADDLASRKAEELLGLIDMDAVARGIEHKLIDIMSAKIIKALSKKDIEDPRKLPFSDHNFYRIEQW